MQKAKIKYKAKLWCNRWGAVRGSCRWLTWRSYLSPGREHCHLRPNPRLHLLLTPYSRFHLSSQFLNIRRLIFVSAEWFSTTVLLPASVWQAQVNFGLCKSLLHPVQVLSNSKSPKLDPKHPKAGLLHVQRNWKARTDPLPSPLQLQTTKRWRGNFVSHFVPLFYHVLLLGGAARRRHCVRDGEVRRRLVRRHQPKNRWKWWLEENMSFFSCDQESSELSRATTWHRSSHGGPWKPNTCHCTECSSPSHSASPPPRVVSHQRLLPS